MDKKVIFFDIDGTLYSHSLGGITKNVKNAIEATRKLGHFCFVASGRPYGYIADNVKEIGFDGYVLANGANIKYQNQDLEIRALDYNDVKELINTFKKKKIEYVLQTSHYCYLNQDCESLLEFYKHCNVDFNNFKYNYDDKILKEVVKMEAWVKNQDELDYVVSHLGQFNYELHPDNHSMEIYSKYVSKATGIEDVLKILNISVENSYCFGDGPNDVEMFETVGHAIAMGNAIDIIKEKADEICLTVDEDGVYYKLKEMFEL